MENGKATIDRLELHNKALLIESAQGKLANGRRLTKQEIKAVEDADNEKKRANDLPFMRRLPKKEYIERFGGSNRVYLEWERRWGFPWNEGERHVNALEILCWYRAHVAGGTESTTVDPDDHAMRLKKAQADREELRLARDRGELLHVSEVDEDFRKYGSKMAEAIDAVGAVSKDAQQIMLDALNGISQEFGIEDEATEETDRKGTTADKSNNRQDKPSSKRNNQSGVRRAVRKAAKNKSVR